jgi:hypothetical protein
MKKLNLLKKLPEWVQIIYFKRKAIRYYKKYNTQFFLMRADNYNIADFIIVSEKMNEAYNRKAKEIGKRTFRPHDLGKNCIWCTPSPKSWRLK